jgi:hypothetical protein
MQNGSSRTNLSEWSAQASLRTTWPPLPASNDSYRKRKCMLAYIKEKRKLENFNADLRDTPRVPALPAF